MEGKKLCVPHVVRRDVRKTFRTRKARAERLVYTYTYVIYIYIYVFDKKCKYNI